MLPPALGPAHVLLTVFPLTGRLSSTTSAAARAALFGGFSGTTRPYDSPRSFIPGVRPQPSLGGPTTDRAAGRLWGLPGPAHEDSAHAQVLRPREVRWRLAHSAARGVAFRQGRRRRHPELGDLSGSRQARYYDAVGLRRTILAFPTQAPISRAHGAFARFLPAPSPPAMGFSPSRRETQAFRWRYSQGSAARRRVPRLRRPSPLPG